MDGVNWKPGVILSNTRNQIDYIVNYLGDARRLTSQMQRGKNGSYLYYSRKTVEAPELRESWLRNLQKG